MFWIYYYLRMHLWKVRLAHLYSVFRLTTGTSLKILLVVICCHHRDLSMVREVRSCSLGNRYERLKNNTQHAPVAHDKSQWTEFGQHLTFAERH